jgi:TM2 domain-containing membrane protein YozV
MEKNPSNHHSSQAHTTKLHELKTCPYCAEEIKADAKKCKFCGEILDEELREHRKQEAMNKWSPGLAGVLSLVIPGAGQIYKGQIKYGVLSLIVVAIGYALFVVPGLILHILCIVNAVSGDPTEKP